MESKIILAVGGIIVVLGAVGGSLGIFGYMGVTTTMLTIEVCLEFLPPRIQMEMFHLFTSYSSR